MLGDLPAGAVGNRLTYFDGRRLVHQPPMREAVVIPVDSINAVLWRRPGLLFETHLKVLVSGAGEPLVVSPGLYRMPGYRSLIESFAQVADALQAAITER